MEQSSINEKEATDILLTLSKAWEQKDCSTIQRLSERLPNGYAFAVFAPKEGNPCFSIVNDTSFSFEIPEGYTYIPDHQLLVASIPVKQSSEDSSAIEEAKDSGLHSEVEPTVESSHDKS